MSQGFQSADRSVTVATLVDNTYQLVDFNPAALKIKSKISWIMKLDSNELVLENPRLSFENGNGWYIYFDFNTSEQTGIYKEEIKVKDEQLIITESRNAQMAMATNCNTVILVNDENHCKCTSKKNNSLDAVLTYRLFTSVN